MRELIGIFIKKEIWKCIDPADIDHCFDYKTLAFIVLPVLMNFIGWKKKGGTQKVAWKTPSPKESKDTCLDEKGTRKKFLARPPPQENKRYRDHTKVLNIDITD